MDIEQTAQAIQEAEIAFTHLRRSKQVNQQLANACALIIEYAQRGIETLEDWEREAIAECSRLLVYHSANATLVAR